MELVYIFCLCGFLLIGYGLCKLIYYNHAIRNYKKTDGVIVDYIPEDNYNSDTGGSNKTYRPLISYMVNGKTYKKDYYKGYGFESSARKNIGRKVYVYYNENDPFSVVFLNEDGIPIIIFGLIFLIIPIIVLFYKG